MTDDRRGGRLGAIGLMSGTSLDGIDVAFVETDGKLAVSRGPSRLFPYEASFRERLGQGLETAKAIRDRTERPGDLAALEAEITHRHAQAVERFLKETDIDRSRVDIIGFHGQTVLHRPEQALTVQLGSGTILAAQTGLPVVADMRAADMVAHGQGAPLAPAYHRALASDLEAGSARDGVVFVNIGGIANVTWIRGEEDPVAFDCGPGNALLDQWVQREVGIPFDQNGIVAAEGGAIDELLEEYLASEFFARPIPKSLDRFDFAVPPSDAGTVEDVARTLCLLTAESIARARDHFPGEPSVWILCGGGRRHPQILADLKRLVGRDRVKLAEEAGFDGDAMEAEAWAYLAVRAMHGLPLTWPTTTGCRAATPAGVLCLPE